MRGRVRLPPAFPLNQETERTCRWISKAARRACATEEMEKTRPPNPHIEDEENHLQGPEHNDNHNGEEGDEVNLPRRRTLHTYYQSNTEVNVSCTVISQNRDNMFEVKPSMVHMLQASVQFKGLDIEDPIAHIQDFVSMCNTFRTNKGVSYDVIWLKPFPFLKRQGKILFEDLAARSYHNIKWNG